MRNCIRIQFEITSALSCAVSFQIKHRISPVSPYRSSGPWSLASAAAKITNHLCSSNAWKFSRPLLIVGVIVLSGAEDQGQDRSGRDAVSGGRRGVAVQPQFRACLRELPSSWRGGCQGSPGVEGRAWALSLHLWPRRPSPAPLPAPRWPRGPPLRADLLRQGLGAQVPPAWRHGLPLLARGDARAAQLTRTEGSRGEQCKRLQVMKWRHFDMKDCNADLNNLLLLDVIYVFVQWMSEGSGERVFIPGFIRKWNKIDIPICNGKFTSLIILMNKITKSTEAL